MSFDLCVELPFEARAWCRAGIVVRNGRPRVFTPTPTRKWQAAVDAATAELRAKAPLDAPLGLDIWCVMHRPESRNRKKDAAGWMWCSVKPDVDNIAKNVADALKAFWVDDCRIAVERIAKVHAEKGQSPRLLVRIYTLDDIKPEDVARRWGLPTDAADHCSLDGQCHGSLKWCDLCGDVGRTCDDYNCDQHPGAREFIEATEAFGGGQT